MSVSVFMIPIVAIISGIAYAAYERHLKHQEKKLKYQSNQVSNQEIEALKERIAVLEKLVTDQKYDLRNEISQLDKVS